LYYLQKVHFSIAMPNGLGYCVGVESETAKRKKNMKTETRNYGVFKVNCKTIRAALKFGMATLRCEVQRGTTPLGRSYRTAKSWWIKLDSSPCASGPWTADAIRKFHA
jgi:hypothetical protein